MPPVGTSPWQPPPPRAAAAATPPCSGLASIATRDAANRFWLTHGLTHGLTMLLADPWG